MDTIEIPRKIPLITLPNQVLLPGMTLRMESTNSHIVEFHMKKDLDSPLIVGIVPVAENSKSPVKGTVATAAIVNQILSVAVPRRTVTVICEGLVRIRLNAIFTKNKSTFAAITPINDKLDDEEASEELTSLMEQLKAILVQLFYSFSLQELPFVKLEKAISSVPNSQLIDMCAAFVSTTFEEKLEILQTVDLCDRLRKVIPLAKRYVKEIGSPVAVVNRRKPIHKGVILKVLDDKPLQLPGQSDRIRESKDMTELKEKIKKAQLPPHAEKIATRELTRLQKMSTYNPEHSVIRNYLELIADLPWSICSSKDVDINQAKEELDKDHYGLFKLKRRVIEYLAVSKLNSNHLRGPILCFVGPPGVGKTSVGRSIANILGRQFQRISLGGIANQSDIRGHRRTYIGAMPGRILHAIKLAGTNNPVILLDEVDKLGASLQGLPAAALLEVLDPEQNCNFVDHYLNIPFDLSQVLFIATANRATSIPSPLLDRLEVINVSGYDQGEKFQIAKNYLLPKQITMHGLKPEMLTVPDDTIHLLIKGYTKEAGVRAMERKLAAVCRAVAVKVIDTSADQSQSHLPILIDGEKVVEILGGSVYLEDDILNRTGVAGVAVGLACTSIGGKIMIVEATLLPSPGIVAAEILPSPQLVLTGQLGDVMRESAQLALNWLRSVAHKYGLVEFGQDLVKHNGVHIHFPAGAVSKDGPSAGVTIATALVSLFTGLVVDPCMAFTGEISLQGLVLPVGGIRDKILAAERAGLTKVVLPKNSINHLDEIPKEVVNSLELIYVSRMSEVIEAAFGGQISEAATLESVKCKL